MKGNKQVALITMTAFFDFSKYCLCIGLIALPLIAKSQYVQMELGKYYINDKTKTMSTVISNSSVYWDYNHDNLFAVVDTSNLIRIIEKEHLKSILLDEYLSVSEISTNIKTKLNGITFYPNTNVIENYYQKGASYDYVFTIDYNYMTFASYSDITSTSYIIHKKYQGKIKCLNYSISGDRMYHSLFLLYQDKHLFRRYKKWERDKDEELKNPYKKLPQSLEFHYTTTQYPITKIKSNDIGTKLAFIEDSVKFVLFDTELKYKLIDSLKFSTENKIVDFSMNQNEIIILTENGLNYYTIENNRIILNRQNQNYAQSPLFIQRKITYNKKAMKINDIVLIGYKNEVHCISNDTVKRIIKEYEYIYHAGFIDSDNEHFYLIKETSTKLAPVETPPNTINLPTIIHRTEGY